jgi:hypothetical protein
VVGVLGFFVTLFLIKSVLSIHKDPVIYKLEVEGTRYLNPSYLKFVIMPIGGVHISDLRVPQDPFISSYKLEYIGNGTALLKVKERRISCVVSINGNYFLASKDGYLLLKLNKRELYHATGYKIFFDISPMNVEEDRVINPAVIDDFREVLSYSHPLEDILLEVDVAKKTLYFVKGVSVKVGSFSLTKAQEAVILKLVESSSIGSRYLEVGNNFVRLPNP